MLKDKLNVKDFLAFCETKDPEEQYDFCSPTHCAVGQYIQFLGIKTCGGFLYNEEISYDDRWYFENSIPYDCIKASTFGQIASKLRAFINDQKL